MTLAIDASSPAAATITVATGSTASFTPPTGSLIYVRWMSDSSGTPAAPTITDSLVSHLTYTSLDWASIADAPNANGQATHWWAVGTGAAMTISTTSGDSAAFTAELKVVVFTDTVTPTIGAHGKSSSKSAASIAQSYTASATGGWGFLSVSNYDGTGTQSAGTGCTLEGSALINGAITYGLLRRTTADDTATLSNTLNLTVGATSTNLSWVYAEILPTPVLGQVAIAPAYLAVPGRGLVRPAAMNRVAPTVIPPGAVRLNTSEGGSNTTAITAGNSGGTSGDAYSSVTATTSCTVTFDSTHAAHGALAIKSLLGATPGEAYVRWDLPDTYSTIWVRTYLYFTANPGTGVIVQKTLGNPGSTNCAIVGVNTTGHVVLLDSVGTTQATSASTIPLNAWFRLECQHIGNVAAGSVEAKIFTSMDSTTPAETFATPTNLNTTGPINSIRIGPTGTAVASVTFWLDDVGVSSSAYLGPSTVSSSVDATLTGTATIAADTSLVKPVDSTLTGTATITGAGATTKAVDGALTGTATITAAASVIKPVDAALTGSATIAAAEASTKPVSSTLTGTATVSPAGASTKPVDSTLTGTATIAGAGASTKPVDSTLTGTATITAAATDVPAGKSIDATVSDTATITADTALTKPVGATLTNTATITPAASAVKSIDAALTATATLSSAASAVKPVTATSSITATLAADSTLTKPIAASVATTAAITVAAATGAVKTIDATVTITAALSTAASTIKFVDASLTETAALTAAASSTKPAQVSLPVAATITATMSSVQSMSASLHAVATTSVDTATAPSVTHRPNTGTTTRPSTGITIRPYTGTTPR